MVILLTGFVCYEILSSWANSKVFLLTPVKILYAPGFFDFLPESTFSAIILFVLFPMILLSIGAFINKAITEKKFIESMRIIAFGILPIIACGHIFKAMLKTTSRIPYWEIAIKDPEGINFATEILNKTYIISKHELLDKFIILLGIIVLAIGFILSVKMIQKASDKSKDMIIPIVFVVIYWLLLEFGPFSLLSLV